MSNRSADDLRSVKFGANERFVHGSDLATLLADFLAFAGWREVSPSAERSPQLKRITHNREFWTQRLIEGARISLSGFHVTQWAPFSPGRYHTESASRARDFAMRFRGDNEFLPLGKNYMILGGIGAVRISAKNILDRMMYVLGASSSGVVHEGIPVAVSADLAQSVLPTIEDTGGVLTDITGTVGILPEMSIVRYDKEIPRYYVLVDEVKVLRRSEPKELLATASVSFPADYHGGNPLDDAPYVRGGFETRLKKAWCFASFCPSDAADLRRATTWIQDYVNRHSVVKANAPPILSDFDEHVRHFESPVEFTLSDLFAGTLDTDRLGDYARHVGITLNINNSRVGAVAVGKNASAQGTLEIHDTGKQTQSGRE